MPPPSVLAPPPPQVPNAGTCESGSNAPSCRWGAYALLWVPLGEAFMAYALFFFAVLIDLDSLRDELRNDCFLVSFFMVLCPAIAYWPIFLSAEYLATGSWFVTDVLAPMCAGLLGSAWCFGFWLNTVVQKMLCSQESEPSMHFMLFSALAGFSWYLSTVLIFRADQEQQDGEGESAEPEVTFACTWPCETNPSLSFVDS